MESKSYTSDIEQKYQQLLELEPKLITNTVPSNAKEQKEQFISGEIVVPDHQYPKLKISDAVINDIQEIGAEITSSASLDPKHTEVYQEFVNGYIKKTRLMQAMDAVKSAPTGEAHDHAAKDFMELNIELYSAPDHDVYTSLLQEKLTHIKSKKLSSSAQAMYDEVMTMLPPAYSGEFTPVERFKPSEETIAWVQGAVEALYGSMLEHVPSKEKFDVLEVRDIFAAIITEEFGESAKDWRVDVEPAKAINVKASEKRVVIPEDRAELSREEVMKMVVHEIGTHVLRSVTGEQTDVQPLITGLSDYYEAEEGLAMIMQQALMGKHAEAGIDHYITAGAAYYDSMDFRDTYELKWRLSVLKNAIDNEEITEEATNKAKNAAYGAVMRIFRGTDELPWFKDLAYYNGSAEMWKFLESIRGDDYRLTLLLMGKVNQSAEHLRTILEAKTS